MSEHQSDKLTRLLCEQVAKTDKDGNLALYEVTQEPAPAQVTALRQLN